MSTASTNMLQLPVATGLDGSEWMWIVQGGTDKRAPVSLVPGIAAQVTRFITAPGIVSVDANDNQIFMVQTVPQAVDIVLPLSDDKIGSVYVSDALGVSTSFNFRLVVSGGGQTIMGLSEWRLDNNYASVTLRPVPGVGYVL